MPKIEVKKKNIEIKVDAGYIYPALTDLEVIPSSQEQVFTHEGEYGYDKVTVEGIQTDELKIVPSKETQNFEGLYGKVEVGAVTNEIDSNIVAENIKDGVNILGVEGNFVGSKYAPRFISFSGHTGTELDYELVNLDISNLTSLKGMFKDCNNLQNLDIISNWNTEKITNMNDLFSSCSKMTKYNLNNWNTHNVTTMDTVFGYNYSLEEIDISNWDISNVTRCVTLFAGCSELKAVNMENCDGGKITYISYIFSACSALEDLKFMKNYGKGFTYKRENYNQYQLVLNASPKLTHESLMSVINNVYDLNLTYNVANGGTLYRQQIKIGSANLAKLTADEIAIATAKGWDVVA